MAAQAKPSVSYDSSLTPAVGGGSLFASQTGACGGFAGATAANSGVFKVGLAGAASVCGSAAAVTQGAGGGGASPVGGLPLGLYVHVPFCSSTCDFCAFYQEKPKRQSIDLYLEAVAAELSQVRRELGFGEKWLWQGEGGSGGFGGTDATEPAIYSDHHDVAAAAPLSGADCGLVTVVTGADAAAAENDCALPVVSRRTFTVFFGGGTPGLLPAEDLGRLCALVRDTLTDFGEIVEWSIELAPATVRPDRVKTLLEHGVTRFSLGVQSFSDELLEGLGRQHSRKQIFAAFETLRACGAHNINCDLMFALPGQTREAWLTDLQTLADLSPEHISTYCLTFEEDTAMWVKLSQGRYKLDPEREADLYRETWAWLAKAGYAQYEVSNFAREGFRSRHNLGTWRMGRWRGVGPSAASQWGGWRFQNPANLEGWAGAVLATERRAQQGSPALAEPAPCDTSCGCTSEPSASASPSLGSSASSSPASASSLPASASPSGNVPSTFPLGVKLPQLRFPPVQAEERVQLTNRLLAADALIFGLRRRDGVNRAEWYSRFADGRAAVTSADESATVPLAEVEKLFERFNKEGLLDTDALAAGVWRLNDEGLLLADAVGGQLLECFEAE